MSDDEFFGEGFKPSSERIKDAIRRKNELAKRVIPFNISYLDDCCLGIYPTDLIVVSAVSGAGKTTLGSLMAQLAAEKGKRVHFLALEAHRDEIEQRMVYRQMIRLAKEEGYHQYVSFSEWMYGGLRDIEFLEARAGVEMEKNLATLSTFYRESKFDADDITKQLLAVKEETDLIILDHLHYVDYDEMSENQGLKRITKTIRDTALMLEVPVVVIAHLRKKGGGQKRMIPDIDDVHGSSDIIKIATKVVVLAPARGEHESTIPKCANTIMQVVKDRFAGVNGYAGVVPYDLDRQMYGPNYTIARVKNWGEDLDYVSDDKKPRWAKNGFSQDTVRAAEQKATGKKE